jgi:hypothetical protein
LKKVKRAFFKRQKASIKNLDLNLPDFLNFLIFYILSLSFACLRQSLTVKPRLALNLWRSCLSLPSAGIVPQFQALLTHSWGYSDVDIDLFELLPSHLFFLFLVCLLFSDFVMIKFLRVPQQPLKLFLSTL